MTTDVLARGVEMMEKVGLAPGLFCCPDDTTRCGRMAEAKTPHRHAQRRPNTGPLFIDRRVFYIDRQAFYSAFCQMGMPSAIAVQA